MKDKTDEIDQNQRSKEICGLLGVGSRFEGRIRFEGTLRIDGTVYGQITCTNENHSIVIVTELAIVEADIVADIVIVSGKVSGNIKATQRLELHAPGRIEGLVYTSDMSIGDGALFQGECVMIRHMSSAEKDVFKMEGFYDIHQHNLIQQDQELVTAPMEKSISQEG